MNEMTEKKSLTPDELESVLKSVLLQFVGRKYTPELQQEAADKIVEAVGLHVDLSPVEIEFFVKLSMKKIFGDFVNGTN